MRADPPGLSVRRYLFRDRRIQKLGQAKVQNLCVAIGSDENVFGLQITVDNSFFVSGREPARDLGAILDGLARRNCTGHQSIAHGLAFQKFGDNVRRALKSADVKDSENVGMIQNARGARFLFESLQAVCVQRQFGREKLDRDVAAQRAVVGAINFAHSARADERANLIAAQPSTCRNIHRSVVVLPLVRWSPRWMSAVILVEVRHEALALS